MEIGAQMYTVNAFTKTTEGISETLKKIADIGYKNVQVSGTCPYDPVWLKGELDKNGLKCVITHTPVENAEESIKNHDILCCEHVGLGWYDFQNGETKDAYNTFIEKYKPISKALKAGGKQFMYHNHDHEFKKYNGKILLEHLAEDFSADELGFTLDTYWVQMGGGEPSDWLEKLSGRVPCIHIKDFAYERKMAVIGEGNMNWDKIFKAAEKSGTKYMLVEQDDCYGEDPFYCLKRSYEFLKSRGF